MTLKTLPSTLSLRGKRVLLRLDWNIPLHGGLLPEESLKIERSLPTIAMLRKRGAIVLICTHLGRPEARDPVFSTERLLPLLAHQYGLHPTWLSGRISDKKERGLICTALEEASPGDLFLLENVRFEPKEEAQDRALAKAYAECADLFVNDAFASCHRAHVSVVGVAKVLPAFAGPELAKEVFALSSLLKPKKPCVAVVGGLKLSTKIPVIKALLPVCDAVLIGGAMAATIAKARSYPVGTTPVEMGLAKEVAVLAKSTKVHLPEDVLVATTRSTARRPRLVDARQVEKQEMIVDVGPRTLRGWAKLLSKAKTMIWNGPLGIVEIEACGAGTRFMARTIGRMAKGSAFGVVGGGDTLPVLLQTKTLPWFDHVSMGGGAMLDFLAEKGTLPGLVPLMKK